MATTFWDERFAGDDFVYGTEPNAFLVQQAHRLAGDRGVSIRTEVADPGAWSEELVVLDEGQLHRGPGATVRMVAMRR